MRLLSNRSPSLAALGLAPLTSYPDLSDPRQAYDFLGLKPDYDEASLWLIYDELSEIWEVDAVKSKQASKVWTAIEEAFAAIRSNCKRTIQPPRKYTVTLDASVVDHCIAALRSVTEKLQKLPKVLDHDDIVGIARLVEKLRFLRHLARQEGYSSDWLPGRPPALCDDEHDIQALRTIATLFRENRPLVGTEDDDLIGRLMVIMQQHRVSAVLDSSTRKSDYKERYRSFIKKPAPSSVLPSNNQVDSSAVEAPKLFISYTISEDRSGTPDEVMAARLAPLRSRDESSPFARASLALLHR